ncbi:MAG: Ni/Fe hydrogenase subunit alpha [Coriobacteriia bacterium]
MSEVLKLPQIKRVEGHGRVSIVLDDDGELADAHFQAVEFRGFEKMLEGRMVWEMPRITSRVCGICPVSHHVASVKAVDALLGAEIPRTAKLLRELLQAASFIHDHALHFYFLAGPDFLAGGEPASRGLLGVVEAHPDLALKAIGLRKAGQAVVSAVGGQAGHPVTAIPGGMSRPLDAEVRDEILADVKATLDDAIASVDLAKSATLRLIEEHPEIVDSPGVYMAQMAEGFRFNVYDGLVTVADATGDVSAYFPAEEYESRLSEEVVGWSYTKVPKYRTNGDEHLVRVGPAARIALANSMGGSESDAMLEEYRSELGSFPQTPFAYHWARMIELVAVMERVIELLEDSEITSDDVRVKVERAGGVGIAAIEAPRGTLIHHYEADTVGRVTKANLIVATTLNNGALNDTVLSAAKKFVKGGEVSDDAVARIEMVLRAYDPCLSCSTHEIGAMPIEVAVYDAKGDVVDRRGLR